MRRGNFYRHFIKWTNRNWMNISWFLDIWSHIVTFKRLLYNFTLAFFDSQGFIFIFIVGNLETNPLFNFIYLFLVNSWILILNNLKSLDLISTFWANWDWIGNMSSTLSLLVFTLQSAQTIWLSYRQCSYSSLHFLLII
jgi:hypothetical protein